MGFLKSSLILCTISRKFCIKNVETKVMKYLNVAEKNDAAKNIAAILSRGNSRRREGLSPYNKIYEFNAQVLGEDCQMVMTSLSGHLLNYEFASMYRSWQSCNPLTLFDAPVIKNCQPDGERIKKTLEREIRSCQGLIIWTDCDREGENIGFEIIKVCTDVKPNLRVYRAKFSEITAASVFRALNTLGQPNKNISDAVDVRQELDLRTGAAFTRLQTLRLQKVFPQKLAEKLISYGSCQFPTLGFVVERYQAIENFIAEPFWRIKMNHTVKELTTEFQWKRDRLFDKNSCEAILDHCKENPTAKVESVESKPKSKWRPLPLDTVAHPPIHPTKYADNLQGNEKRVYEYIVRHFLACVHKDAQGFETTVSVDLAGETFTAKGLIILEKNYLDVYIYDKWNAKEINNYEQGDTFQPSVLEMTESQTSPPKLLTEADLIALMEKHGIGTDATHAEHIDTIKSREYVGLNDIYFVPGTLGMGLVEGYNSIGLEVSLAKPTLRAEFENDLKLICDGLKDPEVVRREQIAKYRAVFQTVAEKMRLIDTSLAHRLEDQPQNVPEQVDPTRGDEFRPALKCPKCGNNMVVRTKKDGVGKFITCIGYPACKNSVWFPNIVKSVEVTDQSCPECGPDFQLLMIGFRPNPFPTEPNPNALCIGGCDTNVNEALDLNLASIRGGNNNGNNTVPSQRNNAVPSQRNNAVPSQRNNAVQTSQNNTRNWNNRTNTNLNNFGNNPNQNGSGNNSPGHSSWIGSTNLGSTNSNVSNRTNLGNLPAPSGQNRLADTSRQDDIVCQCDNAAVLLTVRKDGPNKGKQFYKCASSICNFFLWDPNANHQDNNQVQNREVRCRCKEKAILRTVNKDGPNKGRQFYGCNNMVNGCKFFQWADEDNNGGGSGGDDDDQGGGWGGGGGGNLNWSFRGRASRGRGKKTNNRATPYKKNSGTGETSGTRAKRKCTRCGTEGHTRNRCPN